MEEVSKKGLRTLKQQLKDWLKKNPEPSDVGIGYARKAAEEIKKRKKVLEEIESKI